MKINNLRIALSILFCLFLGSKSFAQLQLDVVGDGRILGKLAVDPNNVLGSPLEAIHLRDGNFRIDQGEIQSFGQLILHPDVDNTGDDIIRFLNSTGGENVRIDGAGNVGVGIASPDAKLHVNGRVQSNNTAIAWGSFNPAGGLGPNFGVSGVVRNSVGEYKITLAKSFSGQAVVIANLADFNSTGFINAFTGVNTNEVLIHTFDASSSLSDRQTYFVVYGFVAP